MCPFWAPADTYQWRLFLPEVIRAHKRRVPTGPSVRRPRSGFRTAGPSWAFMRRAQSDFHTSLVQPLSRWGPQTAVPAGFQLA